MKQILGMVFLLIGVTMLIFFSMSSITTLIDSANFSINASEDPTLSQSFETSKNVTTGAFSIMSNLPLLIVVIIVIIVLFTFVAITR